jgi:hypothetical protein
MLSALEQASPPTMRSERPEPVYARGNGSRFLWVLCVAILLTLLFVLTVNQRILNRLRNSHLEGIKRGCVQVEFSDDDKSWYQTDRSDKPFKLVRLHNLCSGLAVRVDGQEEK